ncbi:MAG: acetate uptake transporter [Conexivisphaera sp.]
MSQGQTFANPGSLGLWGFALTTIVLSFANAGIVHTTGMTLAYMFFWGGMAQVFAGWMDFRRGNMLGGTAFSTYGLFWIGLGLTLLLGLSTSGGEVGLWMFLWGVLTLVYAVGSARLKATVLTTVFILLVITFELLAAFYWSGNIGVLRAAGWMGIITGLDALYLGAATLLNGVSGERILPE